MIAAAERLNRRGERVSYHVNPSADLALFEGETFDFVLSYIVLQHMEPRYAKRYIAEFVAGAEGRRRRRVLAANRLVSARWRPRRVSPSAR